MTLALPPGGADPAKVALTVNRILSGKINSLGKFTLTGSAASSTIKDPNIGADSMVLYVPTTAHASAEMGNGTIYIAPADYVSGTSFKINHANNAQADRSFLYVILG